MLAKRQMHVTRSCPSPLSECKGISFNLLAELKNRLKISIFLWRKSCASR